MGGGRRGKVPKGEKKKKENLCKKTQEPTAKVVHKRKREGKPPRKLKQEKINGQKVPGKKEKKKRHP